MASSDGFQIVTSKKRHHRNNQHKTAHVISSVDIEKSLFLAEKTSVKEKVEEAKNELRLSEFSETLDEMTTVIQDHFTVKSDQTKFSAPGMAKDGEINRSGIEELSEASHIEYSSCVVEELVCYGIGSFSTCAIARYQLALLLLIKDKLKVEKKRTWIFDPLLTPDEKSIAYELGLEVIPENEEGKRKVKKSTIFYMPHCGKALYNNLLWKNWTEEQLGKLIIIGNSFSDMNFSLPEREFAQKYSYIHRIVSFTEEFSLRNRFRFQDIFNDTSVHRFTEQQLQSVSEEYWLNAEEPIYDGSDIEIIQAVK